MQILDDMCRQLEIDTDRPTPGCEIIRRLGASLVEAMQKASEEQKDVTTAIGAARAEQEADRSR